MMKWTENELLRKQRGEREGEREKSPKSPKYLVLTLTGNKQALCTIVKNVTFICATRRNESRAAGSGSSEQNPFPPTVRRYQSGPAATRRVGVTSLRRHRSKTFISSHWLIVILSARVASFLTVIFKSRCIFHIILF